MKLYSVFITGANRGIGFEFTKQLLTLDPPPRYIFATYRNRDASLELKNLRDAHAATTTINMIKMDVRIKSDIDNAKKIVEDLVGENGLTLLINNSGVVKLEKFPDLTEETLKFHFSTNTIGPILVAQALYPLLKASATRYEGSGMSFSRAAILNISSRAGSITNAGKIFIEDCIVSAYKISKAGLNMAMRVISSNVKEDNILVVMMCPGWVKTDMGGHETGEITPEESIGAMLKTITSLDESHTGTYMDRNGEPYPF